MILNLRHSGIVVRDINRAVEFYEKLGFQTWRRVMEKGSVLESIVGLDEVCVETAKLTSPCGALIELLQYHSHPIDQEIQPQPSNQLGCSHIALTVVGIEETLELIELMGGSRVNPPATSANGTVRVAYCHDLEGNLLELVEEL